MLSTGRQRVLSHRRSTTVNKEKQEETEIEEEELELDPEVLEKLEKLKEADPFIYD